MQIWNRLLRACYPSSNDGRNGHGWGGKAKAEHKLLAQFLAKRTARINILSPLSRVNKGTDYLVIFVALSAWKIGQKTGIFWNFAGLVLSTFILSKWMTSQNLLILGVIGKCSKKSFLDAARPPQAVFLIAKDPMTLNAS